jgi:predicted negative regulator of RcsB-dependent stress response
METLTSGKLQTIPTIIGVADSTHYLVGSVDSLNNFFGLNPATDVAVMGSLVEAKNYLRENNIFSAALEFQTAYDEMCGSQNSGRCSQIIKF